MDKEKKRQTAPPLPVKNGVSPNRIWLPDGPWETFLEFFLSLFPHLDSAECSERFERGEVMTSSGVVLKQHSPYFSGEHVFFYRELVNELVVPFEEQILFENEHIVVADKPHFLTVAPTGQYLQQTLLVRLRRRLKNDELELCHRLDRETAGIVLLSKSVHTRSLYHSLFANREITKVYHALAGPMIKKMPIVHQSKMVKGEPYFRMKEVKGAANSETLINLLESRGEISLYELRPVSGRKHQLRVHMAALGTPILNDPLYPDIVAKPVDDFSHPLKLLAKKLQFVDPVSGSTMTFESPQSL
jgi:tRNA pseudouridine32 synthase/23S rRNA pseudouridine746 synthase